MNSWFDDLEMADNLELYTDEDLDADEISPREAAFIEGYLEKG